MCWEGWSYKIIPPDLKVGRLFPDLKLMQIQQVGTEVKFRSIISKKGNKCLIVQTKLDVRSGDGVKPLNGVIPQVGNEKLPTNQIIPATVTVARDKDNNPQIVSIMVGNEPVNMDWFFDPLMNENRKIIEI